LYAEEPVRTTHTQRDEVGLEHVVGRVAEHALHRASRLAVLAPDGSLTYGELWKRALRWAGAITRRTRPNPGEQSGIAVAFTRSCDLVAAQLGAWLSGAPYVPIDTGMPDSRLAVILSEARPALVLTDDGLRFEALGSATLAANDLSSEGAEELGTGRRIDSRSAAVVVFTSGSTGRPKGVVLSHGGLDAYVKWYGEHYDVHAEEGAVGFAALGFDAAIGDVWGPLANGLALHVPSDEVAGDPEAVVRFLHKHRVHHLFLPTPMGELVLRGGVELPATLRTFSVGGARLRTWPNPSLPCAVHNLYGPAEVTVATTASADLRVHPDRDAGLLPPIGFPLTHVYVKLIDPSGQPVADGEEGELIAYGVQVALGYHADALLTAERFGTAANGDRFYRTGDICRRRLSGDLEFVSRRDRQVKVRGYRVELGDIESALMACPGVDLAHASAREGVLGHEVFAWVQGDSDVAALTRHLAGSVPQFMQPRSLQVTDTLPLTPNGKVDETVLLARTAGRPVGGADDTARCGIRNLRDELACLWASVLGVEPAGDGDFFRFGGDSIRATQVTQRVRERFGVEIPIVAVLQKPQLEDYAAEVDRLLRAAGDGSVRDLEPDSTPRPSHLQINRLKRLAAAAALGRPAPAIWVPLVVEVEGGRSDADVVHSLQTLVARHDALRTSFHPSGQPDGWVAEVAPHADLRCEVRAAAPDARVNIDALVEEILSAPVDPSTAPLAQAVVLRCTERLATVVLAVEHLVTDAKSMTVLANDLAAVLEPLPGLPAPLQQSEWVGHQHAILTEERTGRILGFWRSVLPGGRPFPPLELPGPTGLGETRMVDSRVFSLESEAMADLERTVRDQGATVYIALLAALGRALEDTGVTTPVVVHTPVTNRVEPGSENTVGWLAHSVPVPVPVVGALTPTQHLLSVRDRVIEVMSHQEVPLPRLVEMLTPQDHGRAVRPARLFLDYRVEVPFERCGADVTIRVVPHEPKESHSEPGLSVIACRRPEGLTVSVLTDPRLTDGAFVAEVVHRLERALRSLVTQEVAR
jgi:amino acid adenylation domain-containing protein